MAKRGRPSLKTDELTARIVELYEQGKTDKEVAKITGISQRAIDYWKRKHPDFLRSIKEAKSIPDDIVEACLFSRATGYNYMEHKIFCDKFGNVIKDKILKHHPPDVAACIYWLNNRRPERWRNSRTVELEQLPPNGPTDKAKKTFTEFCLAASYPAPFSKQIEMLDFAFNQDVSRLLLGARGYGKTDYITILGVAYKIYLDPEYSVLVMTKSKERNTAILGEIATALKANGVKLEKENSQCLRVEGYRGKDNSVSAVTVKTVSLRGRHPDMIIMDDPVTEDDTSEATRSLVEKKYNEIQKLTSNVLIIGQPAHKFDLYAKLRGLLKKLEVPHGSIPELDHDLEAQRLAGVTEESIQASYFLKIADDTSVPFNKIKRMDQPYGVFESVAFIDPSEGGDYVAMTILRGYLGGVAVAGFVWKRAWHHCIKEFGEKFQAFGVKKLKFETNHTGDSAIDVLRAHFPQVGIIGHRSTSNKHARIMAAAPYAEFIHLAKESDPKYVEHVLQYEYKAKFDDAPDSLASCLEWVGLIRVKG